MDILNQWNVRTRFDEQGNLHVATIEEVIENNFLDLLDRDFIKYLIGLKELKITVEMKDRGDEYQELIIRNEGQPAPITLQHFLEELHPEDKMYEKPLSFFFMIANNIHPEIVDHPLFRTYKSRFLLRVYYISKKKWIWDNFVNCILRGLNNIMKPDLTIPETFCMNETKVLWQAVNHCFHKEIFVHHLYAEFIVLTNKLLLHYLETIRRQASAKTQKHYTKMEVNTTLVDILVDISKLKKLMGRRVLKDINASVFQIIKPEGHYAITRIINGFDDKLVFAYRHIELTYVYYKLGEIVRPLLTHGLFIALYKDPNEPFPTGPSLYIVTIVNRIHEVYQYCQHRNLPDVLQITDTLVHEVGSRFLHSMEDLYHAVENQPYFDTTNLYAQLRRDVHHYIGYTFNYIYEPIGNGTYTRLLNSVRTNL